jgi:hypothetical protein
MLRSYAVPICVCLLVFGAAAQSTCPPIPSNACNNRPDQSTACSASNIGPVTAWAKNAAVDVYIDTTSYSPSQVTAIETAFQNWQAAETSASGGSGVTFNFVPTSGVPAQFSQTSYLVTTGSVGQQVPSGDTGNTQYYYGTSTDTLQNVAASSSAPASPAATTWLSSAYAKTANASQIEELMTHEISHTFGEGDCTTSACAGNSVAYQNGSTLTKPTSCDTQTISKSTNPAQGGKGTGGGSGGTGHGSGGGAGTCSGTAPNDTCACVAGDWECDCEGSPPGCNDGTSAVCVNSGWTCGTVSACSGAAPTCSDGTIAVCANNQWTCSSGSCTDVCDPSCSDYDPTACDSGGGGGGGGGDPGGGGCDDGDDLVGATVRDIARGVTANEDDPDPDKPDCPIDDEAVGTRVPPKGTALLPSLNSPGPLPTLPARQSGAPATIKSNGQNR